MLVDVHDEYGQKKTKEIRDETWNEIRPTILVDAEKEQKMDVIIVQIWSVIHEKQV